MGISPDSSNSRLVNLGPRFCIFLLGPNLVAAHVSIFRHALNECARARMHRHVRQDPHGRFRLIGVDELSTCRTPRWTFTSARRGEFRELKIAEAGRAVAEIYRARRNSIIGMCVTDRAFLPVIPRHLRARVENDTLNNRSVNDM